MSFQYKRVLMIGATSGIGAGMADRLIHEGAKVIAVGRRQARLDDFVQKHGKDKASALQFDINESQKMDDFVRNVTHTYPDLDCVFLNAGTQSSIDLSQPAKVDLPSFHAEVSTNFFSLVDLSVKFLPFLMEKQNTSLIFTGTNLSIVPASRLPAYSASKAALNSFVLSLRDQLRKSTVKVIEISPPVVQTELHDYMGKETGRSFGMPLDQFTDQAYKGLESGTDEIIIGSVGPPETFNEIMTKRRAQFEAFSKFLRGEK